MLTRCALFLALGLPLAGQVDSWDLPPVSYSDTPATDRLAKVADEFARQPERLRGRTPLERVRMILDALEVPESSQILVFSKTSKQNSLIHPGNPRALYFSRDCYAAFVPGGVMEVVVQDPRLGPVFYHIDLGNPESAIRVERDTSDCLSCHGTGRTENVPGVLVRSVFPDAVGQPLLSLGSTLITDKSPVTERWGGYYVTGSISLPHLGNRTYTAATTPQSEISSLKDLVGKIDVTRYPRATSDIVALMVLEHQCQAHNLLTAASMNYRRAAYLAKAVDPAADPDLGTAGRIADQAAEAIVSCFLFAGEAEQGADGVEGNEEFQKDFTASLPRTPAGESLGDFQLNGRLFKNRCSYMLHSQAFRDLPTTVRERVLGKLRAALESSADTAASPGMKPTERQRIVRILTATGVW